MSIYKKEKQSVFFQGAGLFPRHFFTIFALGGASLLFAMKYFSFPQYITVLIPIALILTYCNMSSRFPVFLMSEDRIGDNAYYLGFLYTLTSLSYALWIYASGSNAPEDIIRSFGVALSSTIIGVIARVYYSSLTLDPNDVEKDARQRITSAANALTVELYQATSSFNIYRRSLQQSMEEAFKSINDQVQKSTSDNANKISSDFSQITDNITSTYSELNNNSASLVGSVKEIVQSINKMNSKNEKIFSSLHDSASSFDSVLKQQVQSITTISAAVENFQKMSQTICQQISLTNDQISRLGQAGQNVSGLTDNIKDNLNSLSSSLSDVAEKQRNVVDVVSKHANALNEQLTKSRKYTEETHDSLIDMAKTLSSRLG